MARTLEELKKQYNSVSHGQSLRGGGPGHRHGPRAKGKPKNVGKTVKRLEARKGEEGLPLKEAGLPQAPLGCLQGRVPYRPPSVKRHQEVGSKRKQDRIRSQKEDSEDRGGGWR